MEKINHYVRSIAPIGPLFRDLKIQGQTYLTKEQIRRWYQETNNELPIYQRTQLLQTKLLKKIGGLEKDEAKKDWVKEATEEQLQQVFASDPHQEYSEENERRLRKKLRQQIVRKKFRSLTRGVKTFSLSTKPSNTYTFYNRLSLLQSKKLASRLRLGSKVLPIFDKACAKDRSNKKTPFCFSY